MDDLVQEYLFMGWSPTEIMFWFRSPQYTATHRTYRQKGADQVKARIGQIVEQWDRGWIRGSAMARPLAGLNDRCIESSRAVGKSLLNVFAQARSCFSKCTTNGLPYS